MGATKPRVPEFRSAKRETLGVDEILRRWEARPENLISVLQEIHTQFRHLPPEALHGVAKRFSLPLSNVLQLATFYNCFSPAPRGRHLVRVCLGTACHVYGGRRMLDKVLRELNLPATGTTSDSEFTVEPVRCLGCCTLAPVMRVDQSTHGHLMQIKIPNILNLYRAQLVGAE